MTEKRRPVTRKQQAFIDAYLVDRNTTRAYLKVYGGTEAAARANGARLIAKDSIRQRIDGAVEKAAIRAEVTLESHLARLDELSKKAEEATQLSAAITAEVSRGKASGLYIDRVQHDVSEKLEDLLTASWKGE